MTGPEALAAYRKADALVKPRIRIGTVAWLIERYIGEMNGTNGQPERHSD